MKDKSKANSKKTTINQVTEIPIQPQPKRSELFPFLDFKMEVIILLTLSILLYLVTFWGGFVLDDIMAVTHNKFVQKGIFGIDKILKTDSLFGYVGYTNDLQGGRYRPLSLIVLAFEHQFWNNNAHFYHLVNILLWALTSIISFTFLRKYLFKDRPDIAILSAFIFIIHPIHTEVVANIKSLDEILSLLFLMSSVLLLFKYLMGQNRSILLYIGSLFLYFIALFSKEYGLTFIFIIPLMVHFFTEIEIKRNLKLIIPFAVLFAAYFAIRISIVGLNNTTSTMLQNNPFLYATTITKYSTIMYCLLKYVGLLMFPHPLSYDYTYNQIPIVGFGNPIVLLSLLIYIGMFVFAVIRLKRKDVLSFGILFFMISIFITSNILVDIGALMGERFLFQPSLGFSIVSGYLIFLLLSKIPTQKKTFIGISFLSIILCLGGYKTIARNVEWLSEYTLYTKDVQSVPNSAIANNNAGVALINYTDSTNVGKSKTSNYIQAVHYCQKAYLIHKDYYDAYVNSAIALIRLNKLDEATNDLLKLKKRNPAFYKLPNVNDYIVGQYSELAHKAADKGRLDSAILLLEKSYRLDSNALTTYNNLGILYCMTKQFPKALAFYESGIKKYPNDITMLSNLSLTYLNLGLQAKAQIINQQIDKLKNQTVVQK